jgi:NAD kinase
VTKKELLEYVADPSTHIDMKRVSFYLNKKAKSQAAKESLKKPIETLEAFKASKKKIQYDTVAYADGKGFVDYIANRAQWAGFIPFLIVLDGNGNAVDMVPGMPNKEKLEEIIQRLIKDKKYGIK